MNLGEWTFVGEIAGKGGEAVRAGGQRLDRHPPAAIDGGEGLVEARLGVESRGDDLEPAHRAGEAVERDRAVNPRAPRDYRDSGVETEIFGAASAWNQART